MLATKSGRGPEELEGCEIWEELSSYKMRSSIGAAAGGASTGGATAGAGASQGCWRGGRGCRGRYASGDRSRVLYRGWDRGGVLYGGGRVCGGVHSTHPSVGRGYRG